MSDSLYDAAEIWQQALAQGGLRFRMLSWGKAVRMRQRCYTWRKELLRQQVEREGEVPGIPSTTEYHDFSISLEDENKVKLQPGSKKKNPNFAYEGKYFDLVFFIPDAEVYGQFLSLDGEEIEPVVTTEGLDLE